MKMLLSTLAAATLLSAAAQPADAGRGVTGTREILMHVADTTLPGVESKALALCHLVDQRTAFMVIPLTYSVKSYALADFGCNTDAYIPLSVEQVAGLRDEGVIPADLPNVPVLPIGYTVYSYGVWAVIFATLAGMLKGWIPVGGGRRAPRRKAGRSTAPFELRLVEAMMLTAGADGHLDGREMDMMARAVARITGKDVSRDTVRQLAREATLPETAADFHDFGVGLSDLQRIEVLRAALAIAVADGQITREERAFLDQLALGLMIPVAAIDNMLRQAGLADRGRSEPAQGMPAPA